MNINICEIYPGFDGEVNKFGQGMPSVFIRFQGCNLRCKWCDTEYALERSGGTLLSIEQIVKEVRASKGISKVTITGGEPLIQGYELRFLIAELFALGYDISVETNGSRIWNIIDEPGKYWVHSWLIDYKLPSSGQQKYMMSPEYYAEHTKDGDFIKFVIEDRRDFMEAIAFQKDLKRQGCRARFAYSTTTKLVSPFVLSEWLMIQPQILDRAMLNCQLHKLVFPLERRR